MAPQRGFTYLGLLFAIAFLGLAFAGAGEIWQRTAQRDREEQLLFVGREFGRALAAYRAATPPDRPPELPHALEELLEDRRQGHQMRRHLRRIYADPLSGSGEWGLVRAGREIVAIHSLSTRQPLKQANFRPGEEHFAGAQSYDQWVFRPADLPAKAGEGK